MRQFNELLKRNVRLYLREKNTVFFSLLSMLIVIALMVFFLGDMNIEAITQALGTLPGRDTTADKENAELLILLWTIAGLISINAVTVTLAVYSTMIRDRSTGILNSIYTAPISRFTIAAAYVCSAWICSVIICVITLAISELYCILNGMELFSLLTHVKLFGLICVNSFVYAAIMYCIALLSKTQGAWSGLGTIVGTLVGFMGGIYIPIGSLSDSVAAILKCTPVIYSTAAFRSIMTEEICNRTFDGAPEEMLKIIREELGIELTLFDTAVSDSLCLAILLVCGTVFLILGAVLTKYTRKADR